MVVRLSVSRVIVWQPVLGVVLLSPQVKWDWLQLPAALMDNIDNRWMYVMSLATAEVLL